MIGTNQGGQAMRNGSMVAAVVLATAILAWGEAAPGKEQKKKSVEVANLNLLHGIDCVPVRGDQCRLEERIDLLFEHLAAIDCPDIVTLQGL
jgi:hypothetical protein